MSKPKFRLEDYEGNYAMHCDTEEKAKHFLKILAKNGRKWYDGDEYTEYTYFDVCKKGTVYYFNDGTYGSIMKCETTVLEFDDFDWTNPQSIKKIVITDNEIKSVALYMNDIKYCPMCGRELEGERNENC